MSEMEHAAQPQSLDRHVIVVGFGVPGREVANALIARGMSFCVVELNPATVERCAQAGLRIISGDARSPQTLLDAGIERANMLVLAVPDDTAMLDMIAVARRINPHIYIVARCAFTSAGLEARHRGANQVVIAEQAVAREMTRALKEGLD